MSRREEGKQFPERSDTPPEPEHWGPAEVAVEPETPGDDNAPADERVDVVKEAPSGA